MTIVPTTVTALPPSNKRSEPCAVASFTMKDSGNSSAAMSSATNEKRTLADDKGRIADPLPAIRQTVRALLLASPAFQELDSDKQRQLAAAMVKVGQAAANLIREEIVSQEQVNANTALARPSTALQDRRQDATATALAAEGGLGRAASQVGQRTQEILNAVSFPRFVAELINGVFKALVGSTQQQMHSYVELLNNVAASAGGFADVNFGPARAREWLVERFPESFELARADSGFEDFEEEGGAAPGMVRLREGATPPSEEALRTALGLAEDESVPAGDPERTLVPLARRVVARQRQQMLATLVQMGMQRIVIESGRIHASMRFHIDTRDAAASDEASRFDFLHQSRAAGSFGYGPWGVSASITNTIGYVNTQRSQTTSELNTDLDLNSSVDLNFRTDYLPLDRMAAADRVQLIQANALNPAAEAQAAATERQQRRSDQVQREDQRRSELDQALQPRTPPASNDSDLFNAANQARQDANRRSDQGQQGGEAEGQQGEGNRGGQQSNGGRQAGDQTGEQRGSSGSGGQQGNGSNPSGSQPGVQGGTGGQTAGNRSGDAAFQNESPATTRNTGAAAVTQSMSRNRGQVAGSSFRERRPRPSLVASALATNGRPQPPLRSAGLFDRSSRRLARCQMSGCAKHGRP
ncbi:MAG: hypothetical protein DKINENOH_04865 [bacterium]|nr:hypothetical protein [bacterium]